MKVNWINEKEALEKLISEGVSYERIGRQYGVTGASVKKAARKMGIELEQRREINPDEHFNKGTGKIKPKEIKPRIRKKYYCVNCGKEIMRSENDYRPYKYCSHECQHDYENKQYIEEWKNGIQSGIRGKYGLVRAIRKYLLEKNKYKCQICGFSGINPHTGLSVLQIHHKDGDYTNNSEENLQVLCPNCHSMTDTYGAHNTCGRRKRYGNKRE